MGASFKTGDVVMLKSGGPAMTVKSDRESGEVGCNWFVGGEVKWGSFPPDALKEVGQATTPNAYG